MPQAAQKTKFSARQLARNIPILAVNIAAPGDALNATSKAVPAASCKLLNAHVVSTVSHAISKTYVVCIITYAVSTTAHDLDTTAHEVSAFNIFQCRKQNLSKACTTVDKDSCTG